MITDKELLVLRKKRKVWQLKKNIILEKLASIRCPFRTGKPADEVIFQLDACVVKIADLKEASK
jgi:hypothetical protein